MFPLLFIPFQSDSGQDGFGSDPGSQDALPACYDLRCSEEFGNGAMNVTISQKLGIGELLVSTGNPNTDLMERYYTHLLKLKKKGYQSLLVLVEDGFPAHMSEEDYKSAYNTLILAQLKLGFAIDTIVEAPEKTKGYAKLQSRVASFIESLMKEWEKMIQHKLKNHRDQGHMEDERHHKMIEDDMDLDRVIIIFGSYLKHMVTMDLEPITSLAGEGEEGMEVRGRAFHAAVKAHHWKFAKMKPDERVDRHFQGPANTTTLAKNESKAPKPQQTKTETPEKSSKTPSEKLPENQPESIRDNSDLWEVLEMANKKLGVGELLMTTSNSNLDLLKRYRTYFQKLKKKGYRSILVAIEDGFPAVLTEEDKNLAYDMLIEAQTKLSFAIEKIVEAPETTKDYAKLQARVATFINNIIEDWSNTIHDTHPNGTSFR